MTNRDIGRRRLYNQRISGEKFATAADVVRWMGALQAQDYAHALWAIGLRMQTATLETIQNAIADGTIVRTWPMRGTIHFIPPEDVKWMLELCASRALKSGKRRHKQLELDAKTFARCHDVFREALSGGNCLTRGEMLDVVEAAGISTAGQRGYHILWQAAQSGVICMGPMDDKKQAFVLLDEWVPNPRDLTREEGLAELASRYFRSHGPATEYDLARWAGITVTDARSGIELADLRVEEIDGTTYWTGKNGSTKNTRAGVYLLPGFDEFLLGYKDRSVVIADEHAHKVVPGNNGIFKPMIVIDGQVVGIWQRSIRKNELSINLDPFTDIDDLEALVTEGAHAYSAFVQKPYTSVMVNIIN